MNIINRRKRISTLLILLCGVIFICCPSRIYADSEAQLVKDINLYGSNSSYPYTIATNNTLFFVTNDTTHGTELWKSDGTEEGTVMVKDIYTGERVVILHTVPP